MHAVASPALHAAATPNAIITARAALAEGKIEAYIERVLAAAPPLSDDQRSRLAELLRPVRVTGGDLDVTA